jgi:hypothetical protein
MTRISRAEQPASEPTRLILPTRIHAYSLQLEATIIMMMERTSRIMIMPVISIKQHGIRVDSEHRHGPGDRSLSWHESVAAGPDSESAWQAQSPTRSFRRGGLGPALMMVS